MESKTSVARDALMRHIPAYEFHLKLRLSERREVDAGVEAVSVVSKMKRRAGGGRSPVPRPSISMASVAPFPTAVSRMRSQGSISKLPCTWTDLLLWAALIGKQDLAHVFWSRTKEPLRDALHASRLCRRLAVLKGGAEEEPLRLAAAVYESWASGVLDNVLTRKHAVRLLCAHQADWESSPLEESLSLEESGAQCLDFLAHRQCKYVADMVFCGNYEGSKAAIPPEASVLSVLLQALCPFLPGLFLTTHQPAAGKRVQAKSESSARNSDAVEDRNNEDAEEDNSRSTKREVGGASWSLEDLEHAFERGLQNAESALIDAPKMRYLYSIPKVKVYVHTLAYLCYIGLLVRLVFQMSPTTGNLPNQVMVTEWAFYLVTVARAVEECYQARGHRAVRGRPEGGQRAARGRQVGWRGGAGRDREVR